MSDAKQTIEGEVLSAGDLETQVAKLESELQAIPAFQQLLDLRKQLNDKYADIRNKVAEVMLPAYAAGEIDKKITGDWGSATVIETDDFKIDEALLPKKFWKTVPDTSKIRKTFQLEGKAPKGAEHFTKYGLRLDVKPKEA